MKNIEESHNILDSQDVVGQAAAMLNHSAPSSSELPHGPLPARVFQVPGSYGGLGNSAFVYPQNPSFPMGASNASISTHGIPFYPQMYSQGYAIPTASAAGPAGPTFSYGMPTQVHQPSSSFPVNVDNPHEVAAPTTVGRGTNSRARQKRTTSRQKGKSRPSTNQPSTQQRSRTGPSNPVSPIDPDGPNPSGAQTGSPSNPPASSSPHNSEDENDDGDSSGGRPRWENFETRLLIEAKKLEYAVLDQSGSRDVIVNAPTKLNKIAEQLQAQGVQCNGRRCKNKWNGLCREYKKISDHQKLSGNASYASMTAEERKKDDLPTVFEQEWIELLDSFMQSRPCQNPPSVADSSAVDSAIDDSENPTAQEKQHKMTGKRRRAVGENTRFLVDGITNGMKESMDSLATVIKECEEIRAQSEDKQTQAMTQNCDKLCDVLKFLATAVVGMGPRP